MHDVVVASTEYIINEVMIDGNAYTFLNWTFKKFLYHDYVTHDKINYN